MEINGIINVYKEAGYTSHDVVNIIKRLFHVKTGHTGTLDPDAEGVLPICLGKATKLADYIMADIKGYRAVLKLGITTDTQDTSGTVLSEHEVNCTIDEIKKAVESFVGEYEQIPPMYSAIKINGKKLYELARQGIEVERKKRKIHIYSIDILSFNGKDEIEIDILCSKGTYIRTLCHDIGEVLGCGGTMAKLLRFRSGAFHLENAVKINDLKEMAENNTFMDIIISMDTALKDFEKVTAFEQSNKYLYNGNKINISMTNLNKNSAEEHKKYLLYDHKDRIAGIYELVEGIYLKPVTVLQDFTKAR